MEAERPLEAVSPPHSWCRAATEVEGAGAATGRAGWSLATRTSGPTAIAATTFPSSGCAAASRARWSWRYLLRTIESRVTPARWSTSRGVLSFTTATQ